MVSEPLIVKFELFTEKPTSDLVDDDEQISVYDPTSGRWTRYDARYAEANWVALGGYWVRGEMTPESMLHATLLMAQRAYDSSGRRTSDTVF